MNRDLKTINLFLDNFKFDYICFLNINSTNFNIFIFFYYNILSDSLIIIVFCLIASPHNEHRIRKFTIPHPWLDDLLESLVNTLFVK